MKRTITMSELRNMGVNSWSVKDNSVRGFTTKYTSEVRVGDKVVISNYFTEVIEGGFIMKTITEIRDAIERQKARSAWDKGVKAYALELLDTLPNNVNYGSVDSLRADMLNSADSWSQYSWGGCALVYDGDIAERVCSPSELKKTRNGERRPNANEEWLDVQARALTQAARMIARIAKN